MESQAVVEEPSNKILDPMITASKLALLHFYPHDTKLVFCYNTFYMQGSSYAELFLRQYYYKANRNDILQIYAPLRLLVSQYLTKEYHNSKAYIKNIIMYAIKGLQKLQQTYQNDKIIVLMLQHYIDFLDDATVEKVKDYPVLDTLVDNINAVCFKELWDKVSIKVISDKIDELNIANKEDKTFTACKDDIECYIKMKEERYQKF